MVKDHYLRTKLSQKYTFRDKNEFLDDLKFNIGKFLKFCNK